MGILDFYPHLVVTRRYPRPVQYERGPAERDPEFHNTIPEVSRTQFKIICSAKNQENLKLNEKK